MHKIGLWDIYEKFNAREESFRRRFKAQPTINSVSLFYSQTGNLKPLPMWLPSMLLGMQGAQYTVVESSFDKVDMSWTEWWKNLNDKRDMVWYLR